MHTLRSIRRYPVKSMGGEALTSVRLDDRGLVGDRWYAVTDEDGLLASGKDGRRFRRRDAVFEHRARTTHAGVEVTGPGGTWLAGDPALDAELAARMAAPVRVLPEAGAPHQDGGAVSLVGTATLAWCAAEFGIDADPRRLRVNLVLETDEPFVEESWLGQDLAVGSARLRVVQQIERCRTVDLAQDGASGAGRWLRPLGVTRDLCLAVYADVQTPGTISEGDAVHLGSVADVGPVVDVGSVGARP